MTAMSFHVKRTRVADTSARHELGHPSEVGKVAYSRTFPTERQAQREADAWNNVGDWQAEVLPGRAPRRTSEGTS